MPCLLHRKCLVEVALMIVRIVMLMARMVMTKMMVPAPIFFLSLLLIRLLKRGMKSSEHLVQALRGPRVKASV